MTSQLVQSVDWLTIAPPVLTAAVALAVLVADLFVPPERKRLLGWTAIAGLTAALALLVPLRAGDRSTFCLTPDTRVTACSYTADHFTLVVQLLVLGGALLTALLSLDETRERLPASGKPSPREPLPAGEYWFLLLSSAAGAALLPASRDLATLVVALEVASLPAFALVGLRRGDRRSGEAALKFFLSSVTATAVTLLGASFVYAATGTLHLTEIAQRLDEVPGQLQTLAEAGVALTLVGFAFKTAAVPFHFWVPDTYVGAPLPVAAYLSVVGKAVGFTGLILVAVVAFPSYADVWGPALAVLAALTMTAGNVAALRQSSTRAWSAVRLLAWSSVAQAGYLLVPIAAAAYSSDDQIGATVAYALMYAVVNLGAFAVVVLVARASPEPDRGLPGPVRGEPRRRPRARLLPPESGRFAPGYHRPLRQGDRLLGGRRRGPGLAGRGHGAQRRDRAVLLPPLDGPALPHPGRSAGGGAGRGPGGSAGRSPGSGPGRRREGQRRPPPPLRAGHPGDRADRRGRSRPVGLPAVRPPLRDDDALLTPTRAEPRSRTPC